MRQPDGRVTLVEPSWTGKLGGFTLLFEAMVPTLAQQMPFAAVARAVGESWHRVHAICKRYVELALAEIDLSDVTSAAVDETSYKRGHNCLTLMAAAKQRKVVFVTEGRDAATIEQFAAHVQAHNPTPGQITSVSIDMSPAFTKGVSEHLPTPASPSTNSTLSLGHRLLWTKTRRLEQKTDPDLKGLRWALLKDRDRLSVAQGADLDSLVANVTTKRTAQAWLYREQLRDILDRKQINVVSEMLEQWCINVMCSKVEPMKEVARMIRKHFDGIVAWTQTRQTNGFLESSTACFRPPSDARAVTPTSRPCVRCCS
ncbi:MULTISPECIES: transposase [Paraburkholderia]|uniref:transposase n=1 Tax=Paraburkholderia TaxID=1822464 RepID=UPI0002FC6D82